MRTSHWLSPTPDILTPRLVHAEPPATHQCRSGSYTQHWCPRWFLPVDFCLGKLWFPVSASLSLKFWEQLFTLWLTSLRRVVDCSVCSDFYLLLGQSNKFQALYMPDQKPDVSILFLRCITYFWPTRSARGRGGTCILQEELSEALDSSSMIWA